MRLSDIMSHMDLAFYPKIALAIFAGVFILVSIRVLRASRGEMKDAANLPLDDDNGSNLS